MEEQNMMEVEFATYCDHCKHYDLSEVKDPCNECLEYGMRNETRVPLHFENKNKKEK